jgi:hypothetical protein
MAHHCHATGCNTNVPRHLFMCPHHWYQLPKPMRDAIWKHYRDGQCDDMEITTEYADAARKAVTFIAKKEGKEPDTSIYDVLDPKRYES